MSGTRHITIRRITAWLLVVPAILVGCSSSAHPNVNLTPAAPVPQAGQARVDDKGIQQVWVPAGSFKMGSDAASIHVLEGLQPPPPGFVLGELPGEQPQHYAFHKVT
jgi:hypothetical protein